MDWIAVSAIAEIVGAIAVVLTLAYLATQVNHNTQAARRAAAAEAVSAVREANAHLADDPAAAAIYRTWESRGLHIERLCILRVGSTRKTGI